MEGWGVQMVLLCQHFDIFPKMHIVSIQIGDVFIGTHRKLHERREIGRAFWPQPLRLQGWSSWLVKLLFFRCTLAGKHISSQAVTQCSPSQYGCHAEEPIEGKALSLQILIRAKISRPVCHCAAQNCGYIKNFKDFPLWLVQKNYLGSKHLILHKRWVH